MSLFRRLVATVEKMEGEVSSTEAVWEVLERGRSFPGTCWFAGVAIISGETGVKVKSDGATIGRPARGCQPSVPERLRPRVLAFAPENITIKFVL